MTNKITRLFNQKKRKRFLFYILDHKIEKNTEING